MKLNWGKCWPSVVRFAMVAGLLFDIITGIPIFHLWLVIISLLLMRCQPNMLLTAVSRGHLHGLIFIHVSQFLVELWLSYVLAISIHILIFICACWIKWLMYICGLPIHILNSHSIVVLGLLLLFNRIFIQNFVVVVVIAFDLIDYIWWLKPLLSATTLFKLLDVQLVDVFKSHQFSFENVIDVSISGRKPSFHPMCWMSVCRLFRLHRTFWTHKCIRIK